MPRVKNAVWIELPLKNQDGTGPLPIEERREHARLATLMMRRLGVDEGYEFAVDVNGEYWWGGPMGGWRLREGGHWFNLEALSGEGVPHAA